ncbi:hypothetical protein [Mesobacillus foraminis]|nr:hypothetical protein [Mesobacillus foraminis]
MKSKTPVKTVYIDQAIAKAIAFYMGFKRVQRNMDELSIYLDE